MAVHKRSLVESVLQRFPAISHAVVFLLAVLGPTYAPIGFVLYSVLVNFIILGVNCRTAYGTFLAWRGVKKHASTDWRAVYAEGHNSHSLPYDDVEHIIVIPNYQEDITVLRETLYLLSTQPLAGNYRPVLAMEAREMGARAKAETLLHEFGGAFKAISYTLHPSDIDGEAAGKSSNLSWAVRQAWFSIAEDANLEVGNMVITVLDADTALAGDFFAAVSCKYAVRSAEERTRMSFVPPIVFDRNASDVPIAVRLVDMLWAMGGLSTIYPSSSAKIPTSAYSLSLTLALRVGFWDAGPTAIGEDMHMFIKTLFCTAGNLISETIYSPASQLDVCGGEHSTFFSLSDHTARYKQAVRHLWGSLDTGYMLNRFWNRHFTPCEDDFASVHRHGPPIGLYHLHSEDEPAAITMATNWVDKVGARTPSDVPSPLETISEVSSVSSLDLLNDDKVNTLLAERRAKKVKVVPFLTLALRLYEAHLLIGHITILAIVRSVKCFSAGVCGTSPVVVATAGLGPRTIFFVDWANILLSVKGSSIFVLITIAMIVVYDRYHQQAARYRWQSSDKLGAQPSARSYRPFPRATFDIVAFPAIFAFGVVPCFHAQIMHIFTNRLTYTVSFKPAVAARIPPTEERKQSLA